MKLFRPKAPPPVPDGGVFHFHFGQTNHAPDTPMELAPAIERVASELKTLRAVVDAAAGCRAADYLRAEIERTKSLLAARNEELVTKQAQCRAGLMKERDLMSYVAAADAPRTAFHVLHEELTKRTAADAAQVELTRIADALR